MLKPNNIISHVYSLFSPVTSPPDTYLYADTHGLVWDKQQNCWTKDSLSSDLSAARLSPSPLSSPEHHSSTTLPSYTSIMSLEGSVSTLRAATPELSQNGHHFRPHSQMSFVSDDLQTIPSQEVCRYMPNMYFPEVL